MLLVSLGLEYDEADTYLDLPAAEEVKMAAADEATMPMPEAEPLTKL